METWAFTIKYNPNGLTEDEYMQKYTEIMSHWEKQGVLIEHLVHESTDKKGIRTKLHLHGRCKIKRGVYRKKLILKDYHIKLEGWRDAGWTEYCNKNKIKMHIGQRSPNQVHVREGKARMSALGDSSPSYSDCDNQVIPKRSLFRSNI